MLITGIVPCIGPLTPAKSRSTSDSIRDRLKIIARRYLRERVRLLDLDY
jgi:hypothetical protein